MTCAALSASAFLQRIVQIAAPALQRGRQPKENAASQRNQHRKEKYARVQMNIARTGEALRQELQRSLRSPCGQQQTQRPRGKRQQQTFRQELAHESCPARAQCRANREFARARCRSSEHQVRHVDARNQKHKSNCGKQNQQQYADFSHHRLLQWPKRCADTFIGVRIRRGKIARDALHICARLFDGHVRLHSANAVHSQACAALREQRIRPLAGRRVNSNVAEES